MAQSTVDLHLKEISEFLHGSVMNNNFHAKHKRSENGQFFGEDVTPLCEPFPQLQDKISSPVLKINRYKEKQKC